ncbi:MAG TPA: hypothetical protein VJA82_02090, partial [Sediminibacterium sp.]|uniref:hypothetical protein n=1 Tax=Sediminibacterium sp. TaxID=1917865 RepID=UPI002B4B24A5
MMLNKKSGKILAEKITLCLLVIIGVFDVCIITYAQSLPDLPSSTPYSVCINQSSENNGLSTCDIAYDSSVMTADSTYCSSLGGTYFLYNDCLLNQFCSSTCFPTSVCNSNTCNSDYYGWWCQVQLGGWVSAESRCAVDSNGQANCTIMGNSGDYYSIVGMTPVSDLSCPSGCGPALPPTLSCSDISSPEQGVYYATPCGNCQTQVCTPTTCDFHNVCQVDPTSFIGYKCMEVSGQGTNECLTNENCAGAGTNINVFKPFAIENIIDNTPKLSWYVQVAVALGYFDIANAETGELVYTNPNNLPYGGLVALGELAQAGWPADVAQPNCENCIFNPPCDCNVDVNKCGCQGSFVSDEMCVGNSVIEQTTTKTCGADSICRQIAKWAVIQTCNGGPFVMNPPEFRCSADGCKIEQLMGYESCKLPGVVDINTGAIDYCSGRKLKWETSQDCGCCQFVNNVCRGTEIWRDFGGNTCSVNNGSPACGAGQCSDIFFMDCGPGSNQVITYCSGGTECTLTTNEPGTCKSKGGVQVACDCPGAVATCGSNGECMCVGGPECVIDPLGGPPICTPDPNGVGQAQTTTCTVGAVADGCDPISISVVCDGSCTEPDPEPDPDPDPDPCKIHIKCNSWPRSNSLDCHDGFNYRNCIDSCGGVTVEARCCVDSQSCEDWGSCIDGVESRTCTDNCGSVVTDSRCCVDSSNCLLWGVCSDGTQTRTCLDNCGDNVEDTRCCSDPRQINCIYGICANNVQTLTCIDNCGDIRSITRCCVDQTNCGDWGACINGIRNKVCTDNCGGSVTETEPCSPCVPGTSTKTCPSGMVVDSCESCFGCATKTCPSGMVVCQDQSCPECQTITCPNGSVVCQGVLCPECIFGVTTKTCSNGTIVDSCDTCPTCIPKTCPNGVVVCNNEFCPNCTVKSCVDGSIICNTDVCPTCIKGLLTKICPNGAVVDSCDTCPTCTTKICPNGLVVCESGTCSNCTTKTCPNGTVICVTETCPTCTSVWTYTETPCVCGFKTVNGSNNCNSDVISEVQSCTYENPLLSVGNWLECINGQQSRISTYQCTGEVTENRCCVDQANCGDWGVCVNGSKSKICTDNCGSLVTETEPCSTCVSGISTKTCPNGIVIDNCDTCPTCTTKICPNGINICQSGNCSNCTTKTCPNGSNVCSTDICPTCVAGSTTCFGWSTCVNGSKSRTCTDSCSTTTVTDACCTPVWTYTETPCICGSKIVNGTNNCDSNTTSTPTSCTYINPLLSISNWSECIDGSQTRTLTYQCTAEETIPRCCVDEMNCNPWQPDPCVVGEQQNRDCVDNCGAIIQDDPQDCPCTPGSTTCTEWSECINGNKSKTCTDTCTEEVTTVTDVCCITPPFCYTDACFCSSQLEYCTETCSPYTQNINPLVCEYTPIEVCTDWSEWSGWSTCVDVDGVQTKSRTRNKSCQDECNPERIDTETESEVCVTQCPPPKIDPPFCFETPCFCYSQEEICDDGCSLTQNPLVCSYIPDPANEICGDWSACVGNIETQSCTDECGLPLPDKTRLCECTPGLASQVCDDGSEIDACDICPPFCEIPPECTLSECVLGQQTSTCTDSCTGEVSTESQCCWDWENCTEWSECVNGEKIQTCTDNCNFSYINSDICPECTPGLASQVCPNDIVVDACDECPICEPYVCENGILVCLGDPCPPCNEQICADGSIICDTDICPPFCEIPPECTLSECVLGQQTSTCTDSCTGEVSTESQCCWDWENCTEWSECVDGEKIQTCTDNCNFSYINSDICPPLPPVCEDPPECTLSECVLGQQTSTCTDPCTGEVSTESQCCWDWENCTEWSECVDGEKIQTCTDNCNFSYINSDICPECTPGLASQVCDDGSEIDACDECPICEPYVCENGILVCLGDPCPPCNEQICADGSIICDTDIC